MKLYHLDVTMITDHGYFTPASGKQTFESFPRQQVSIYNFGCHQLESTGLKWQSYAYDELWQGGLNEAVGNEFTLEGDGDYLIFCTFEPKILNK